MRARTGGRSERREQLGSLYREEPTTFGEFTGVTWDRQEGAVVTNDSVSSSWVKRYQTTVRAGSFERRRDTFPYLVELLPLTFDRITHRRSSKTR
jgi:hypothetical protein